MHHAIADNIGDDFHGRAFQFYIRTPSFAEDNPCTWRGASHVNNRLTTFLMQWARLSESYSGSVRIIHHEWYFDLDFLPSTVRNVHFWGVQLVNGWRPERLPRDMKYLALRSCSSAKRDYDTDIFDFRKLPARMEELHADGSWLCGTLCMDSLPKTMRYIVLQSVNVEKILVDSQKLPLGFQKGLFRGQHAKISIENIGDGPLDDRLLRKGEVRTRSFKNLDRMAQAYVRMFRQMEYIVQEE